MKKNAYIIVLAYLSLLGLGFLDNHRGPFYQQIMEDLGLTDGEVSYFFTVASLSAFAMSYVMPIVFRHVRAEVTFRVSLGILGLGFYLFAISQNLLGLILSSFIFGVGFGIIAVVQNLMIYSGSQGENRSRLFAGLHSTYALAALLAPMSINILVGMHWGWREIFKMASLVPCVLIGISYIQKLEFSLKKKQDIKIVRSRSVVVRAHYMAILFSLYIASEIAISSRLVVLAQRIDGLSLAESNNRLTLFFLGLLVGRLFFSAVRLKERLASVIVLEMVLSIVSIYLGLFYSFWWISLTGLFMSGVFPLVLEYLSREFADEADYAISILMAIGSLTVVLMHFSLGYFTDLFSIKTAIQVSPFFLTVALILFIIGHYAKFPKA